MAITTTDLSLLKLMQLVSANLPVGGFSFSQGLESACDLGWIKDKVQTEQWLAVQIDQTLAFLEIPIFFRLYDAALNNGQGAIDYWNDYLLANRETQELYLADTAMGQALRRLILSLEVPCSITNPCSFTALFALVASYWNIDKHVAATGLAWTWLENQITAAAKLVPLGQTQAQQLIVGLQPNITQALDVAKTIEDDQIGASLPALSIASSLHEHQYSRLFRS